MGVAFKNSFIRVDFMGRCAVVWQRYDRHIRFLQALAQANMMKRLSSEDGQGWLFGTELFSLPGLRVDKWDRASQLNSMKGLGLIKFSGTAGTGVQIDDLGLQVIQLVKDGAMRLVISEDGTARAIDSDYHW